MKEPKTSYKVWVVIEEYNEETEHGEDIGPLEIGCSGTFKNEEAALSLAKHMHDAAMGAPGWTE